MLTLSPLAQVQMVRGVAEGTRTVQPIPPVRSQDEELQNELLKAEDVEKKAKEEAAKTDSSDGLSPKEQAQVKAMAARDAEVRAHEQAHKAVGGALTGSISYSTEKGPDGKHYAVGGHVPIDLSPGSTPAETEQKAMRVIAAALAPADPSPADKSVAAKAAQMATDARSAAADEARAATEQHRLEETAKAEETEQKNAELRTQSLPKGLAKAAASYARWAA